MDDQTVMASADVAAAALAAEMVTARIDKRWQSVDGPATALFTYRRRQGPDVNVGYSSLVLGSMCWSEGMSERWRSQCRGHPSLDAVVEWIGSAFERLPPVWFTGGDFALGEVAIPETHFLVWRHRPEFERHDGLWNVWARYGFIPKDAWFLEVTAP